MGMAPPRTPLVTPVVETMPLSRLFFMLVSTAAPELRGRGAMMSLGPTSAWPLTTFPLRKEPLGLPVDTASLAEPEKLLAALPSVSTPRWTCTQAGLELARAEPSTSIR